MRIRRITLSTLASHHRDQSLLAHRHIIPPSSPPSPHAPPFITSLAYHFVSPSRIPNIRTITGHVSATIRAVISAQVQRGATHRGITARKPACVRCRFWPAYSITVQLGYEPGMARWFPLVTVGVGLYSFVSPLRIRYYQDNASSGPNPSISIPWEAAAFLHLFLRLSRSLCHEYMPSSSLYRHVRSIDQPPYCTRNVLHTCIICIYIYNTSVCMYMYVYTDVY